MSIYFSEYWPTIRIRDVIRQQPTPHQKRALQEALQVSFLSMEAIGEQGNLDLSAIRNKELVSTGYTSFFDGDVLVAKITPCFENGKGAVARSLCNGVGFGTTELHVLSPSPELDAYFLYYITASQPFREIGEAHMMGAAGQKRVPAEFIYNYRILLPPLATQRAIAAYLDRETAKIDAMIDAKQRLRELLKEKRRALITHAVTRGLDPNAPLRESGVPWIGKVPAHWEVAKLKVGCQSLQIGPFGSQVHAEDYVDNGIPIINPVHIINGKIVPDMQVTVDNHTSERLAHHQLETGDVIFARRGEIGRCVVVTEQEKGWLCGSGSLRVRPTPEILYANYLFFCVSNTFAGSWLSFMSVGTTMKNLNTEIIEELPLPLPPVSEQVHICREISSNLADLDQLHLTTQRSIDLLHERRAALITAAVTGQIAGIT